MRIALAVEGTRGDVHPMLSLGKAFQAAGHEAVLCGPGNLATVAAQSEIEFREVGSDTEEFLGRVAGAISSRGLAANRVQIEYCGDVVAIVKQQVVDLAIAVDVSITRSQSPG